MQLLNVAIFSSCVKWLVALTVQSTDGPWHEHLIVMACTAVGATVVFASIGFGFALEALTRARIGASSHKKTRG
jgi:hypothetical protein